MTKPVGEPDAGNPHVRCDERGWETERCRMAPATAPILDSTFPAEQGCPHSRRVLERNRTNHGHCKFGADDPNKASLDSSGLSNASSPVREVPANSCLPPGQNEKHNIVWHRFVPQRSNQKTATEGDARGLPQSRAQRAEGV